MNNILTKSSSFFKDFAKSDASRRRPSEIVVSKAKIEEALVKDGLTMTGSECDFSADEKAGNHALLITN